MKDKTTPNYDVKEGEDFRKPLSDAELIIEGESSRIETRTDATRPPNP
jgi:hypothetical protein